MPRCAILTCRNDSGLKNLSNGGVSYHRFPHETKIRERWINAIGRQRWCPSKTSTICSKHFTERDFIIKKSGKRYMKPGAIPRKKIVPVCSFSEEDEETSSQEPDQGAEKAQCSCCLDTVYKSKLSGIWQPQNVNGDLKAYGTMLVDCFALNWHRAGDVKSDSEMICQYCIWKLNVAVSFKKEVLTSQKELIAAAPPECNVKVKIEVEDGDKMVTDSDDERNDDEVNDKSRLADNDDEKMDRSKDKILEIKIEYVEDGEGDSLNSEVVEKCHDEAEISMDDNVNSSNFASTNDTTDPLAVTVKLERSPSPVTCATNEGERRPLSNAQKCRNYRARKKEANKFRKCLVKKSNAELCRMYRLRKKMLNQSQVTTNEVISATSNSLMAVGSTLLAGDFN